MNCPKFAGGLDLDGQITPTSLIFSRMQRVKSLHEQEVNKSRPVTANERQIDSQERQCDGQLCGRDLGCSGQDLYNLTLFDTVIFSFCLVVRDMTTTMSAVVGGTSVIKLQPSFNTFVTAGGLNDPCPLKVSCRQIDKVNL